MVSESAPPGDRRCRITLKELADSFDLLSADVAGFLDLEAGEVRYVSADAARDLERIYEALPISLANASDEEQHTALLAAIEEEGIGTTEEEVLQADAIDRGLDSRYVALPDASSRDGYRDMEAFIETVANARLQSRLDRAIRGRGAFRRFRDELLEDEAEEQRWYAFKQERLAERAREWLADEGIELIAE